MVTRAGGWGGGGGIKLYPAYINNLFIVYTFQASCNHVTLDQILRQDEL